MKNMKTLIELNILHHISIAIIKNYIKRIFLNMYRIRYIFHIIYIQTYLILFLIFNSSKSN